MHMYYSLLQDRRGHTPEDFLFRIPLLVSRVNVHTHKNVFHNSIVTKSMQLRKAEKPLFLLRNQLV